MKKIFLLSMCILCMLVSCSSDDDDNKNVLNSTNIVGHWKCSYIEIYDYETENLKSEFEDHWQEEFKLYDDGTCLYGRNDTGTYKILGNELDIFVGSYTYKYTIEDFGYSKMKVKRIMSYRDGYDEYGLPYYVYEYWVYTMERVN